MDITYHGGQHFLTPINCRPSEFSVWQPFLWQNSASVIHQLESVFCKWGQSEEILTDNNTIFPADNSTDSWMNGRSSLGGIVDRCHQSVKRITTRKQCIVMEAVYWYNTIPRDNVSATNTSANVVNSYQVWVKRINGMCPPSQREMCDPYRISDSVSVKPHNSQCTTNFKKGHVTVIVSEYSVLVDVTPRHVMDLCLIFKTTPLENDSKCESLERELLTKSASCEIDGPPKNLATNHSESSSEEEIQTILLQRSTQNKRLYLHCYLCDHEIRSGYGNKREEVWSECADEVTSAL